MDRKDFLEGLRAYLEPEVSAQVVQENINYYERYITEEVVKGRREEAVVEELGDPWILAKTIIDMEEAKNHSENVYEAEAEDVYNERRVRTVQFDSWWKKFVMVFCIIGIVVLLFSLITGLIRLLVPVLLPVVLVVTVYRLITGNRRY